MLNSNCLMRPISARNIKDLNDKATNFAYEIEFNRLEKFKRVSQKIIVDYLIAWKVAVIYLPKNQIIFETIYFSTYEEDECNYLFLTTKKWLLDNPNILNNL